MATLYRPIVSHPEVPPNKARLAERSKGARDGDDVTALDELVGEDGGGVAQHAAVGLLLWVRKRKGESHRSDHRSRGSGDDRHIMETI